MRTNDILTDALSYALEQQNGVNAPVLVINATGSESDDYTKQSGNACYNLENTVNGVFNTILVRATRQTEETLGLLALAATHAAPDARILIAQENAHGAPGLEKHMRKAWADVTTISKFKCRIMTVVAGEGDAATLKKWADAAAIRKVKHNRGEFWSAPGVFSWDRPDAGSRLLLERLPKSMPGKIADLGCGNGLLAGALAKKEGIRGLWAIDANATAVECCRRNLAERGGDALETHVLWRDATGDLSDLPRMDWVVMNPPFHDQQDEDRGLGQKFCDSALKLLRSGGELVLVANRHMPYEALLENSAASVRLVADMDGFKIIRATAK